MNDFPFFLNLQTALSHFGTSRWLLLTNSHSKNICTPFLSVLLQSQHTSQTVLSNWRASKWNLELLFRKPRKTKGGTSLQQQGTQTSDDSCEAESWNRMNKKKQTRTKNHLWHVKPGRFYGSSNHNRSVFVKQQIAEEEKPLTCIAKSDFLPNQKSTSLKSIRRWCSSRFSLCFVLQALSQSNRCLASTCSSVLSKATRQRQQTVSNPNFGRKSSLSKAPIETERKMIQTPDDWRKSAMIPLKSWRAHL